MVGGTGRILSTIIDRQRLLLLFTLLIPVPATAEQDGPATWAYFDAAGDVFYSVWTETTSDGENNIAFSFRYNFGGSNPRALVSGIEPVQMSPTDVSEKCFTAQLQEQFEYSVSRYLICFEGKRLLLVNLSIDSPEIMPDYLVLDREGE